MHLEKIKSLMDLVAESSLAEIELIEGDHAVRLVRRAATDGKQAGRQPGTPLVVGQVGSSAKETIKSGTVEAESRPVAADTAPLAAPNTQAEEVLAPMFGVVHLRPAPDASPFVTIGATVAAGATICTIEAMKTFNAIEAEKSGVIAEILVTSGQEVSAGTPLFRIA